MQYMLLPKRALWGPKYCRVSSESNGSRPTSRTGAMASGTFEMMLQYGVVKRLFEHRTQLMLIMRGDDPFDSSRSVDNGTWSM